MKPVLLDTSVVVALLDRSDNLHEACAKTIRELKAPLITCEAVIAENCYLLRNLSGAPEAVIENIAAEICQIPLQLSRESAAVKHLLRKSARQLRLHVHRSIHLDSTGARNGLFGVRHGYSAQFCPAFAAGGTISGQATPTGRSTR